MTGAFRGTRRSWAITITIILAAEIFVADLVLPLGLAVWLPYAGLVLISLWGAHRRHTIYSAIAATALLLLAGFLAPPGSSEVAPLHSWFNRAVGVLFIWMTAGFCFQRKRVEEAEQQTHEELERLVAERTAELSQSNARLQHEVHQRQLALAELEETRQQQLLLKDQFLSNVSHELRSPLTAIYQFVTILRDGLAGELNPEQSKHLDIVFRNTNQLRAMIGDLLEVTRAGTGRLSIQAKPTSVADLIDETINTLSALAAAKGISVSTEAPGHLPLVHADPQRVRQILRNLIENAIKFTPDNGTITVKAQRAETETEGFVAVVVTDTGCGISQEECDKIFDRLYQAKHTIETSRRGLGLGLYICRELVSLHGGRIWVESRLGYGSTFVFTLPICSLENLLTPLITNRQQPVDALAVIAVEIRAGEQRPLTESDEAVLLKVRDRLTRCLRADLDVLLPRIGHSSSGEIFFVVARCDQHRADLLGQRIQEELASDRDLREAGLISTLSLIAADTDTGGSTGPAEHILSAAIRSIEERLQSVPGRKEM